MFEIRSLKDYMSDGETVVRALANIREAKAEWVAYMLENNLPISELVDDNKCSGNFVVRIPKYLHKKISEQSKIEGLSLNQYVANSLAYVDGQKQMLLRK